MRKPKRVAERIVMRNEIDLNPNVTGENVQEAARRAGVDGFAYIHPDKSNRVVAF
jgi:hypothetical protein